MVAYMHEPQIPCTRQQELIEEVQRHLLKISGLMRAISEAIANRSENTVAELDKQVDLEFGLKERAIGALQEHRKEHGC
jgi:hypothetical protein